MQSLDLGRGFGVQVCLLQTPPGGVGGWVRIWVGVACGVGTAGSVFAHFVNTLLNPILLLLLRLRLRLLLLLLLLLRLRLRLRLLLLLLLLLLLITNLEP